MVHDKKLRSLALFHFTVVFLLRLYLVTFEVTLDFLGACSFSFGGFVSHPFCGSLVVNLRESGITLEEISMRNYLDELGLCHV